MRTILLLAISILFIFKTHAQDLSSLYKQSVKSVVTLFTTEFKISADGITPQKSLGSGVIIDKSGLILTAAHVVGSANTIQVKLHNDNSYEAEVIHVIPTADLALIKIISPPANLIAATINTNKEVIQTGNQVYIIGAPLGIEQSLSSGYVSGILQKNNLANGMMVEFIQTDAAINQGNSGGPMFDFDGKVVGIVSFIMSQSGGFDGIGYAASAYTANEILLKDDSHFWSGFDSYFLDESLSAILNVPQKSGLLIQRVSKNSLADKIGLQGGFFQQEMFGQQLWLGGDIILEMLGSSCNSPHSLQSIKSAIKKLNPGDKIYMKILRHGKILDLSKTID